MSHPLEKVIREAEPFLFIGDSSQDRFPAFSFANAQRKNHQVYYYDIGGMSLSRGLEAGKKVYTSLDEVPEDRTDLAVVWVKPKSAKDAVKLAIESGAKRIWFSFQTGHPEAVDFAKSEGLEVVEVGRCPVYYMDGQMAVCKAHTAFVKMTGAYGKPPQTEAHTKKRELY